VEGKVPVFISPRKRVARLYPQELGSIFFASYDSQGYVGASRLRLHMGDSSIYFESNVGYYFFPELLVSHKIPRLLLAGITFNSSKKKNCS
jgi:hypothetical protein